MGVRGFNHVDDDDGASGPVMTKEWLKAHCKKNNQYATPSLNDKLYLHFKGFEVIQNLEEYTGLKALFVEGNGLDSLKGLSASQKELKCLFAQQNCIRKISDLEHVTALNTLNLSNNCITHVEGLDHLPDLQNLQLASNKLETLDSIRHLAGCAVLSTVDLSNNNLDGPEPDAFLEFFQTMPSLQVLYLKGNPIVTKFSHYRKRFIAGIPKLTYLDDRPVFENERRLSEAWVRGGFDEERKERQRMKDEEAERDARQMSFMRGIRDAAAARKQAAQAAANGGLTDAEMDAAYAAERAAERALRAAAGEDADDASSDDLDALEEPEELVRAREALAQYAARPGEEEPPELTETRMRLAAEGRLEAVETRPWQPALPENEQEAEAEGSGAASPGTPPAKAAEGRAAGEFEEAARAAAAAPAAEEDEGEGEGGAQSPAALAAAAGEGPNPEHSAFVTEAIADASAGRAAGGEEAEEEADTPDAPDREGEKQEKWGQGSGAAAPEEEEDEAVPMTQSSLVLDDITLQDGAGAAAEADDDEAEAGATGRQLDSLD